MRNIPLLLGVYGLASPVGAFAAAAKRGTSSETARPPARRSIGRLSAGRSVVAAGEPAITAFRLRTFD